MRNRAHRWLCSLSVLGALASAPIGPGFGQPAAADHAEQLQLYLEARRLYEVEAGSYWDTVAEKRRQRNAKRRAREPIGADDYVLAQPPLYSGPPRPVDPNAPRETLPEPTKPPRSSGPQRPAGPKVLRERPPEPDKPPMPVVADFLRHADEQFGFMPHRPQNELAAKKTYVAVAKAAGLTKKQVVHVYAFETGGNGTYEVQAGLTSGRPDARAISPALGYNQLLSTNSVGLIAENGERYLVVLERKAARLTGPEKAAMATKIAALRRMITFSRSVPNAWSAHDELAKNTPGGIGIHAVLLDRDLGPLLQTQKLLNSVVFARRRGHPTPLTAAELELMNFTGDGNGYDMVLMPAGLRRIVPTANFFQRAGYERNPIARRTGTVAALIASMEARMERAARERGAKDMAAAF